MTEKRWEFELDGGLLPMPPEAQQPKERNGKHAFLVNGHPCEVVIIALLVGFANNYALAHGLY
ncbi:MAG: hypothetical protein HY865_02510 [Chloroflexi bacterium]|nr:hypothetical protein [Chloroflexota bacterium]